MDEFSNTIGSQCTADTDAIVEHAASIGAVAIAVTMVPDAAPGKVSVRVAPIFFPLTGADAVGLLDELPAGSTIGWRKAAA